MTNLELYKMLNEFLEIEENHYGDMEKVFITQQNKLDMLRDTVSEVKSQLTPEEEEQLENEDRDNYKPNYDSLDKAI